VGSIPVLAAGSVLGRVWVRVIIIINIISIIIIINIFNVA